MLTVPVEIRKSDIHGYGTFAQTLIKKGAVVWNYTPGLDQVVALYAIETADPRARNYAMDRGFINPDRIDEIVICVDEAQFMNFPRRGEPANTMLGGKLDRQYLLLAATDIPAGAEITVPPESDFDYERKMKQHES